MRCTCARFRMQINAKVVILLLLAVQAIKVAGNECSEETTEHRLYRVRSIHKGWRFKGSRVVVPTVVAAFSDDSFLKATGVFLNFMYATQESCYFSPLNNYVSTYLSTLDPLLLNELEWSLFPA